MITAIPGRPVLMGLCGVGPVDDGACPPTAARDGRGRKGWPRSGEPVGRSQNSALSRLVGVVDDRPRLCSPRVERDGRGGVSEEEPGALRIAVAGAAPAPQEAALEQDATFDWPSSQRLHFVFVASFSSS